MYEYVLQLLGFSSVDEETQAKIERIIAITEARLMLFLGGVEAVPNELQYIVTEVSVVRYNRIASEGFSSHTVEGESIVLADDDFAQYRDDIQTYLDNQKPSTAGKGIVRFI